MRIIKNAAFAMGAVALLLGGLLVLVPTNAGATQVHLVGSDISQLQIAVNNVDNTTDVYSFDVTATVRVPMGQLAALDYARVDMAPGNAAFSMGMLSGVFCAAETTATMGPRSTIVTIQGDVSQYGQRTATRYTVTQSGDNYTFTSPTSVNFGYGYGYGRVAHEVEVTVVLRVTGCLGPTGSAAPFAFAAATPQVAFRLQVFLGANAGNTFPSIPVTQVMFDPNYVAPTSNTGPVAVDMDPTPVSTSGDIAGVGFTLADTDGDGNAFEPVPVGTTFPPQDFPDGVGGETASAFTLTANAELPAGTQVLFEFDDQAVTNSATTPPFGIGPAILSGALGGAPPAFYMQVRLSVPGEGFVPATGRISVDITYNVEPAYFTANSLIPSQFQLRAFRDDGTLKSVQPSLISYNGLIAGKQQFVFRISDFSSFVAFAPVASGGIGGGGGGGGGGGSTAPATSAPVTTPPLTTLPVTTPPLPSVTTAPPTSDVGVTPAPASLGPDSDGDSIPDSVELIVGSNPNDRTSAPVFDLSDSLVVVRTAAGNVLTWTPNPNAKGYQVWSSNSPWVLIATIQDPQQQTFTDAQGMEGTKYKVTYFVGESTPEGKLNLAPGSGGAIEAIPGWSEGNARTAAAPATTGPAEKPGTSVDRTQLFIVVALVIAAVALLLMIARRKKGNT